MKYQEAWDVICPFGKHKGKTLGDVYESRDGKSYIHWLTTIGEIRNETFATAVNLIYNQHRIEIDASVAKKESNKAAKAEKPAPKQRSKNVTGLSSEECPF